MKTSLEVFQQGQLLMVEPQELDETTISKAQED